MPIREDIFMAMCPMRHILQRLSDKWTLLVLVALFEKDYQYGELHRKIEGISRRMLTHTLQKCMQDGLVSRAEQATQPITVRYSLTPLGRTLEAPLTSLKTWAEKHGDTIELARRELSS